MTGSTIDRLDLSSYDFLDFGCSAGGSLGYCRKRFGADRGLGVDLDQSKVERTRAAGYDAIVADASCLRTVGSVRFVSMLDFLEHLPDLESAEAVIGQAAECATDFLFIRHPSFEYEPWVRRMGVIQYWWNWSGHSNHLRVVDYCQIFDRLGLHQYSIRYLGPVVSSEHDSILTVDEARNQHQFDPGRHRPRPYIAFDPPLWRMQEIFVALAPFRPSEWSSLVGPPPSKSAPAASS